MLVLSRKNNESIMLGDDIEIIVLGIHGCHRVQIGIEAPANVTIKRKEIHDAQRGHDDKGDTTETS